MEGFITDLSNDSQPDNFEGVKSFIEVTKQLISQRNDAIYKLAVFRNKHREMQEEDDVDMLLLSEVKKNIEVQEQLIESMENLIRECEVRLNHFSAHMEYGIRTVYSELLSTKQI